MSWYRTGTVAVTNGSKTVTGVGTLWTTAVNAGDAFALVDANLNPTGAWYEVESVTNNTTLVLKQSYTGSTGSNKQYCVFNLVGNMTTPSFAQRLAQFFDSFQGLLDQPTTTPTASSIPIADGSGKLAAGWLPAATTSASGVVELATAAEAQAGTDSVRAVTSSGLRAALLAAALNYGFHPSLTNAAPADLNTLLTPGIYTGPGVSGTSSWPGVNTKYGYVIVLQRSSMQVMQMVLYPSSTGVEFYIRAYTDGTWTAWNVFAPPTLAATSTDDATSATAAPLKSAGGLAVAKDAWVGGDTRLTAGGIHGGGVLNKTFWHDLPDAGTYKIKIASQAYIIGALDISVFGTYGTTNREGYASYKVLFNRTVDSITIIPVQAPKDTGGSFTTGYSFNVAKPDTDTLEIAITKGSGAIYYVGIQGVFTHPHFAKTVTTEFIPA